MFWGHVITVEIETVAREYLTPLKNAGVDTLILGCTHYPLLTDVIGCCAYAWGCFVLARWIFL